MAENPINLSVFISPITYIIGFMGCIVLLSMLKSFIAHGVSIAITEWLLNHSSDAERMKVVRWFANGDDIMDALKRIEKNTSEVKAE